MTPESHETPPDIGAADAEAKAASMPGTQGAARRLLLDLGLILLIAAPLFFFRLGAWPLGDPDEGRYAEISREMIASGDYVTPTLNFVQYFEKPPLLYWLVAGSFRIFGGSEWAARLVPALAATAGLIVTYVLGRRMFGRRAGLLAGVILATSLMWAVMARALVIDMLVSVLIVSALALWWLGHAESDPRKARRWFLGFWTALALSVLAKGPVAVVLVGGTVLLYVLVCRQWRALTKMNWPLGLPLFAAIAAPWFVLVSRRNPGFFTFFWYDQHVKRFLGLGTEHEHTHGLAYFLLYLPVLFLPWSPLLPAAAVFGRKRHRPVRTEAWRAAIYLLGGAAVTTVFFSLASGKVLTYVLPVLPLLAILLAAYLDRIWDLPIRASRWPLAAGIAGIVALILAGGLGLCAAGLGLAFHRPPGLEAQAAVALGVVLLIWAGAVALAALTQRAAALTGAIAAGFVASSMVLLPILAALAPGLFVKPLLDATRPGLDAGGEIVMYESYAPSASFYLRRRIPLVGSPGELRFGMLRLPPEERERWFASTPDSLGAGSGTKPVYYMTRDLSAAKELISRAGGSGAGLRVITGNRRRIVVGNARAAALTPPGNGAATGSP